MLIPATLPYVIPTETRRNNNVIITSNDVATSILRSNDVISASCVRCDIYCKTATLKYDVTGH